MTIRFDPPGNPGRIPSRGNAPRRSLDAQDHPESDALDRLLQDRPRAVQLRTRPLPRQPDDDGQVSACKHGCLPAPHSHDLRAHDYTAWAREHAALPRVSCATHGTTSCTCLLPVNFAAIRKDIRPLDPLARTLRDQLGSENFTAPEVADDGKLHRIGDLASALNRSADTIRRWISDGTIPDAEHRGDGDIRWWTTREINMLVEIAEQEQIMRHPDNPRMKIRHIKHTNFSAKAWAALAPG